MIGTVFLGTSSAQADDEVDDDVGRRRSWSTATEGDDDAGRQRDGPNHPNGEKLTHSRLGCVGTDQIWEIGRGSLWLGNVDVVCAGTLLL
ncbi:MAG: hypothetical protein JOZ44_06755 [Acidobacteria bacterium]|nr:hypothetical protein [Acidobacteriota bacterium]